MLSVDEPAAMNDEMKLIGLISSRICHDLISPIGAIGNGMELLDLAGLGDSEEISLIRECAETAADALKFIRIAFGDRDENETIAAGDLFGVMRGHLGRRRVTLDGEIIAGDQVAFGVAKGLMLMALTAAGAAPRGCALTLCAANMRPYEARWEIRADAIRLSERTRAVLADPQRPGEMSPGEAHLMLLHMIGARNGARLSWSGDDTEAVISLA